MKNLDQLCPSEQETDGTDVTQLTPAVQEILAGVPEDVRFGYKLLVRDVTEALRSLPMGADEATQRFVAEAVVGTGIDRLRDSVAFVGRARKIKELAKGSINAK